jgi:hypothetical protein
MTEGGEETVPWKSTDEELANDPRWGVKLSCKRAFPSRSCSFAGRQTWCPRSFFTLHRSTLMKPDASTRKPLHCYQFTVSDVDEHMQRDCIAVALERANDRGESCDCPLHALRIILHLTTSDGTARIASMLTTTQQIGRNPLRTYMTTHDLSHRS